MKRKLLLLGFFIALLTGSILRLYRLGSIPNGLYQDETAIGYNAYSLLTTGRDEYGKPFPLYFKSFGDYKLPVYIYMTVASIRLFGMSAFAVRFPSALFGILTLPVFYLLVKELTKNKLVALLTLVFISVSPWHIHYSRGTFEVSIGLFFISLGAYLLHLALTGKGFGKFLSGTLCFLIAFYSYNLTRLLAPILYFGLLWIERKGGGRVRRTEMIATFLTGIVLLLPFVLSIGDKGGSASAGGTLIFSSAQVIAPLTEFRSYMISLPALFSKLFFNIPFLTLWQYGNNIASYLSVPFFFITGSNHGNHGLGTMGLMYLFELPLLILGIDRIRRESPKVAVYILFWAATTVGVASLTRESPHATRSFFLLFPLMTVIAFGALGVLEKIRSVKEKAAKIAISCVLLTAVLYNLVYFAASYFVRFPVSYAKAWRSTEQEVAQFIQSVEHEYDTILFDRNAGYMYTSLLFYTGYPPRTFQDTVKRTPDDSEGFVEVTGFGKYLFRDIDWPIDGRRPRTLIITSADRKPENLAPLRTFYYPIRPVVFAVKQTLVRYPVADIAFVAVSSSPEPIRIQP